jgi:hypothetical protein
MSDFKITKEQKAFLDSLVCQRLNDSVANKQVIEEFRNPKSSPGITNALKTAWKTDKRDQVAYYIIKDPADNQPLLFFSLQCGEMHLPLDPSRLDKSLKNALMSLQAARTLGGEIAALGINTDFAPVMDVNSNPRNPIIGTRSFSDDPQTVSTYGVSFVEGLKETGTITALKHFPGHGDVATDSHTGFPVQEKTYDELKECELVPFQAAIDAGADMVMTAHIQYPSVDSRTYTSTSTGEEVYYPATLSDRILKDILREDMGFE